MLWVLAIGVGVVVLCALALLVLTLGKHNVDYFSDYF